jgi:hypothetical protein
MRSDVRVPTYACSDTCNDTCITLSGRVQRHLYFDLLRCSAWSLPASQALLVIIVTPYIDILCAGAQSLLASLALLDVVLE